MSSQALRRWAIRPNSLRRMYAISFLVGVVFWYGIEKLFLQEVIGVGPAAVSVLVFVYTAIVLTLDLPAGILADRWGLEKTLALAIAVFIVTDVVLGSASSFLMYVLGIAGWGLFTVLYYGTYEALLYETALSQGRTVRYEAISATHLAWFTLGLAISATSSGFIADALSLQATYYLSLVPACLALGLILTVRRQQPAVQEVSTEKVVTRQWSGLVEAFSKLFAQRRLVNLTLGMLLVLLTTTPMYQYAQFVYIELFDGGRVEVGIMQALASLLLIVGFVWAIRTRITPLWVGLVLIGLFGLSALMQNMLALVPFMAIFLVMPLLENTIKAAVQHAVTSGSRATMTSAINVVANLFVIPAIFVFGWIAESISIWSAYGVQAGVIGLVLMIYLWHGRGLRARGATIES